MKIKRCLFFIICCFFFPLFVSASGGISLSSTSTSLYVGSSSSFKITASNAAGKVSVSVDDSSIASINQGNVFLDNESVTVKVTAKKVGTTTVKVYLNDMTTYDDEDISGKTYTYKVTVKEKPNYSTNNKLKSISVDGYELTKKDNNNYTLTVNKDTSSIKINATAEDSKAKVSNTGKYDLKIGENKIEIIITSESGSKNTINVVVTRRDGYILSDLNDIIKNDNVIIDLDSDTTVKKSDLDIIKENKKIVTMNYLNDKKETLYSWIFDGSKIEDTNDILTTININSDNEDISKLINYSNALYIIFSQNENVIKGSSVNINTSSMFNDGDIVKLYSYNDKNKKIELVNKELTIKDNSVTLDIDDYSTYFLTKATVIDMDNINEDGSVKKSYLLVIIIGAFAFLELCFIGFMFYTYEFKKGNLI